MYRYHLLIAAAIFAAVGYWLSARQPNTYEAAAVVILRDPNDARLFSNSPSFTDPERFVAQQASLANSVPVFERAAELAGDVDTGTLSASVQVDPVFDLNRLNVRSTARSAVEAALWANSVARAFQAVAREQRHDDVSAGNAIVDRAISDLRKRVEELTAEVEANPSDTVAADRLRRTEDELLALERRMSELSADVAMFGSGVQLVEEAQVPQAPASPNPVRDAAMAVILAGIIGSAIAYWRAGQTSSHQGPTDPGVILDAPLLGDIPRHDSSSNDLGELLPGTPASEAYRIVLSSIEFSLQEMDGSTIMVTSAASGDGKTSTALHLAVAAARTGRKVLLVDADLRKRGLTSLLQADGDAGLADLAAGTVEIDRAARRFRLSDDAYLSVIPAGQSSVDHAIGLMRTPNFKKAVQHIRQHTDFVIFDSSPLLAVADAAELAAQADAIVLVLSSQVDTAQLERVRRRLTFVPAPLIGYVQNHAAAGRTHQYGFYSTTGDLRPVHRPLRPWSQRSPSTTAPNGQAAKGSARSRGASMNKME